MHATQDHSPQLFVLLEFIRSAHNVGSVFRICDSAGVDKLYLAGWTACPPHPKVAKTALGSTTSVHWEHHCSALSLGKLLLSQGVDVVALEPTEQAVDIYKDSIQRDTCLVFGHEEQGISPELLALCTRVVAIPQAGTKNSLNISVACGVAVYEYRRKLFAQ